MGAFPAVIGTTSKYRSLGTDNVGNVLHAVAGRRLLQRYTEFPTSREWTDDELERVESHSHIVIIMANAVRLGAKESALEPHHEIMRRNIERTTRPVVVFGLGAQAAAMQDAQYSAPPGTLRLLKVVSERSRRIAVRGEFTADALRRLGINNPEVIGCQSCFLSREGEFPFPITDAVDATGTISFNYTSSRVEKRLIQFAVSQGYDMIGQLERFEAHAREGLDFELTSGMQSLLMFLGMTADQYRAYCREHFHVFNELDPWLAHMKRYSFSMGSRFHGNMMALQAGIPALWLVHDERTRELCDFLKLPHVELHKALEWNRLEDFIEVADYGPFLKAYPERYRRLKAYVEDAGLPHTLN
ncbi:polysaccharide pyruvyl transferase family protein [Roseomonas sp. KE0001]|uniref:polysaccharide pyruvyl transferase family protein n=1 Tax=Roseomonas sp. KE0001 TaxID=2479201 RepID=UPI001ED3CDD6|nr:polysaccharide pyruvyl transferase family protein [Roseomonas sp. KE0001]MBI0434291.1 polysaccharide pyruvyl transferase family protein [Roseomonas sp. KE0001]